ncbi:MAG: two-component system sensor histidine kinase NtrB [bacterium]
MAESNRTYPDALARRVEEVRGLSHGSGQPGLGALDDPRVLAETVAGLADDLELAHRRVLESQVQLAALREVGRSLLETREVGEATRRIVRFLRGTHDLEQVGLLLVDRERGVLTGTWAAGASLTPVEVPLVGAGGALPRALWDGRTVQHHDPVRHPALVLPEGHPLARVIAGHSWYAGVPLEPASGPVTAVAHEDCTGCALGRTAPVPPPGADTAVWRGEVEAAQRRCARCPRLPLLGVLVAARGPESTPPPTGERARLEAVAATLAPLVENMRLVHDLARSERFLGDVLDSMPSALVAFDDLGRALTLNAVAHDLLGTDDGAVGTRADALLGEEGGAAVRGTLDTGLPVVRRELTLRSPAGLSLPVRLTTSRLRDADGRSYGALATFLDLTPLRAAEDRARQLDRLAALGRFTSMVAHEIRNPLTGIGMGVRHLARALRDRPGEEEHVEFILREIRRLDGIVQELFDVTHPRKLDLTPRALGDTLAAAARSVAGVYDERHVTLTLEPATLPLVPHDADRLQQVLINLLKNAAEASPAGARVTVRATVPAVPGGTVVVTVADEGPGLDAEAQRTLFEPFSTTKPKGTGLGLYVSHEIVKSHGGSLTVRSIPGSGATFAVELPLDHTGGTR